MSLYFEERVEEEQITADLERDKILFSIRMITNVIPPTPEDSGNYELQTADDSFRTTYAKHSFHWKFCLSKDGFQIDNSNLFEDFLYIPYPIWKGSCNYSYNLYSDYEKPFEIYSSPRMSAPPSSQSSSFFQTAEGSMKEFTDAFEERKVSFVVIFIELELPMKYFFRPFKMPWFGLKKRCEKYPEDKNFDFRFEFLNESDFTIKCPDGNVPAMKMVLNVSNSFLKEHLKQSNGNELIVDHCVDVIKPLITYIHSGCFEMPEVFDIDYADRLLKALIFFELDYVQNNEVKFTIYYSLCDKFVEGFPDFESIVQLLSVAYQHSFYAIIHMIAVEIATKYYYKWHHTSSINETNVLTRLLFDSIISEDEAFWISREIEEIFKMSLLIKGSVHVRINAF